MKKQMKTLSCLILLIISVAFQKGTTQCNPVLAETCDESIVFCSLDQLNGYSCSNTSAIPSPCSPICSQGGVANNTSWWGFVTQGGTFTITLNVGNCANNQGLEYGIYSNCACSGEVICRSIPCIAPNSISVASAALNPCKTYYLWIDGCNGDVCDFTINTSGGGPPTLAPIGKINNITNSIIEPICEGACNVLFFVNPQPGSCKPTYVWTLDGNEVGGNSNEVRLDMPDEGDFIICVTAFIGNPNSGSICAQQGPQCATAKVRRIPDVHGVPRTLCREQIGTAGFKWHSQRIFNSGTYHEQFSEGNCCRHDSIVEFTVLETPQPANVYYITCDNIPYTDITGKKHTPCKVRSKVILSKTTDPFKCDSSILLTAINVDYGPSWVVQCLGGMIELIPNIRILKPCNAGETYEFEYKWYKKSDPTNILGSDERLMVQSVSEDYCIEVKVRTELETESLVCTKTFCESFNESNLSPDCSFTLESEKIFCFDPVGTYRIKNLSSPNILFHNWTIDGGFIVSNPDSAVVDIKWLLRPTDTGRVCVSYDTDCGTSCEKCITIQFDTKIAGEDFEHRGLSAYLDAKPNPNGMWRLISGPYPVRIEDPTFARTKITATNYGYYCFEWTVTAPNCTLKDTLCVNLHNFKKASPEYPKLLFFERAKTIDDKDQIPAVVFTPNLIQNNGESFVNIEGDTNGKISYHWFDIYGRLITQKENSFETGTQRINIHSPIHEGMYFLVIEIDGVTSVRKVCVIE